MSDSEEDLSIPQDDSEEEFDLNEGKVKKKANKKTNKPKTNSAKSEKKPRKKKNEENNKKSSKKESKSKAGKSDLKKVKKNNKEKKTTRKSKPKVPKEKTVKIELNSSFSKPGQRYMTPPQGDGTRGFYESLYEENPNSLIAIKFCVEYGIFGGSKHDEVLHKYTQLQKHGHFKGTSGAIKPSAITFLQKLKTN
uniref:Uncharacterized protein n=1 Tax=Theileria annulata TaxID=5874 RepID=A0A3B0NFK5_THEAN